MSSMSLASFTFYRKKELEERIGVLYQKCRLASENIEKMKSEVNAFPDLLNCEQSELKDRFLALMKCLDERIYIVDEFNLLMETSEFRALNESCNSDTRQLFPPEPLQPTPTDLHNYVAAHAADMPVVHEGSPDSTSDCFLSCESLPRVNTDADNVSVDDKLRVKPQNSKAVKKERKIPDDCLVYFSSTSTSRDSVSGNKMETPLPQLPPAQLIEAFQNISFNPGVVLPVQKSLNLNETYTGFFIHADLPAIYIITDQVAELDKLRYDMKMHYSKSRGMDILDLKLDNYYAAYDEESTDWYRALYYQNEEEGMQFFFLDTGEFRFVPQSNIRPLHPMFTKNAPFARCCHLAEFEYDDTEDGALVERIQMFLDQFLGKFCTIKVDDNNSESLSIYLTISDGNINVNEALRREFCVSNIKTNMPQAEPSPTPSTSTLPISTSSTVPIGDHSGPDEDLEYDTVPMRDHFEPDEEYDDPLQAVTGYQNRDEADICKSYVPGKKKCFKKNCTKKHIPFHPDGWTLDKVPCLVNGNVMPLPLPGTYHSVTVTAVPHFDRVYVQFIPEENKELLHRDFGVTLPPQTLLDLFSQMNSPTACYQKYNVSPAIGELIAAKYTDESWYRATVISVSRAHQCLEVRYVDYGTTCWVSEKDVRKLPKQFSLLPTQAILCRIVDIRTTSNTPEDLNIARSELITLVLNQTITMKVMSRCYDEMDILLMKSDGSSYTEILSSRVHCIDVVQMSDECVEDDTNVQFKYVVA